MSSAMIIGLEMTLVLGGVLGLAVWELLRLRRDRRERAEDGTPNPPSDDAPDAHRHHEQT